MSANVQVDPDWVAAHLDDPSVRVVEVDVSAAAYDAGHLPGAVLWDAYVDLRHPDYTPIDPDELDALLSTSGVTPESTVVFYGYAPYLGLWLMDRQGHERIRLMDGPRERWAEAGYSWSTAVSEPKPSAYKRLGERPELIVSRSEVQELIGDSGTVLIDVRSEDEFTGERFWPSGATEGAGRPATSPAPFTFPSTSPEEGTGPSPTAMSCGRPAKSWESGPVRRSSPTARSGTGQARLRSRSPRSWVTRRWLSTTARGPNGGLSRTPRSRPDCLTSAA